MKATRFIMLFSASVATLCLAGCFTVDTEPLKYGGEHVVMRNSGWKLFDWIPLVSGNANEKSSCGFVLFRDDVTYEKMQHRFEKHANGRTVDCPMYDFNDTVFFDFFYIPIPYILTYKDISISGTMK